MLFCILFPLKANTLRLSIIFWWHLLSSHANFSCAIMKRIFDGHRYDAFKRWMIMSQRVRGNYTKKSVMTSNNRLKSLIFAHKPPLIFCSSSLLIPAFYLLELKRTSIASHSVEWMMLENFSLSSPTAFFFDSYSAFLYSYLSLALCTCGSEHFNGRNCYNLKLGMNKYYQQHHEIM